MKIFKNNDRIINEGKIVDQLRALSIDMIHEAKSGHPGIALGVAPILYTLFANHLKIIPKNPDYYNRDRFILSAGHASSLLYATLYLAGFDISLEDLKKFRQIDSKTPGHPEYKITPGVEMTTGPLGQGIATGVGIAIGEAHAEALLTTGKNKVIDYNTYVLVGDGDLMEGVSYEAISLAGTLKLGKLIVLYDSNDISLDGKTALSFTESVRERFEAMGWHTLHVMDGEDLAQINKAISDAKNVVDKPTLIEIKTTIGKYSKFQGTNVVHGTPLEEEDITNIKNALNIRNIPFTVSTDVIEDFQYIINERCKKEIKKKPKLTEEDEEILNTLINENKSIDFSDLDITNIESTSLREAAGKVLAAYCDKNYLLFGGSADLFSSCKNYIEDKGNFTATNYVGQNIYFGVREHAMASIMNGITLAGFRAYGSTMLAFSDYMKPAIRLTAMMRLPNIYIFTHDSLSIGEDGATHQPVEQLSSLRNLPNLEVFRPCDINEVIGSYKAMLEKEKDPSVICLSRNNLKTLENTSIHAVSKGGYIIQKEKNHLDGILIASGEEIHLVIEVAKNLFTKGKDLRVVSMPNIERFLTQDKNYIDEILPVETRKIAIEMSLSTNWNKIIFNDKYIISQNTFGASGKKEDVLKKFGFDVETLEKRIENLL